MPVTKTAKRALRSSNKKADVNYVLTKNFQATLRLAEKSKSLEDIKKAVSLIDKSVKKKLMHINKAARLKSRLAKLAPKTKTKKAK